MHKTIMLVLGLLLFSATSGFPAMTLVPMDETQTDHLKAYGLAYWMLQAPRGVNVEWLLNYRGGSFLIKEAEVAPHQAALLGIKYEIVSESNVEQIHQLMENENMDTVLLEKAPEIAIYIPPNTQPWDDAVTLALEYADIPYEKMWDDKVLAGKLADYDWLHVHHEDFTGQYGKFYANFRNAAWYQEEVSVFEHSAQKAGFTKVSEHKNAVAWEITKYMSDGGFMFSMCSACDSFDISLAATGLDIVAAEIDGDGLTPGYQKKLDYAKALAFQNFTLYPNPNIYEFSDIDIHPDMMEQVLPKNEKFTLFEFSAKLDPVPTMLTQCHTSQVKEYRGQTTAFWKDKIKPRVLILGEFPGRNIVKYLHGNFGQGSYTYLAGHDPEDVEHFVGEEPTDLNLHKNSPGYRLILNNILFPAAKKKEKKT